MNISKFKISVFLLTGALLVLVAYVIAAFYIKNIGIELNTDKNFDYSREIEYFLQNDPNWANQKLGNSDYTLAEKGCTIADVAMVLSYLGNEINPTLLNEKLTQNKTYTKNGGLLWYKLEEIYPVKYKFKRVFSAGTLESDLEDGILPIMRVKYGKQGLEHWVLVVGADGKDFLIMDPLNKNKTLTRLGEYRKVYAYRALVPKGF